MKEQIHIGGLIKAKMEEDGRSASWLAEKLHCDRPQDYPIYDSIVSKLLRNFFDVSDRQLKDYGTLPAIRLSPPERTVFAAEVRGGAPLQRGFRYRPFYYSS
jgi:hypothetical protein